MLFYYINYMALYNIFNLVERCRDNPFHGKLNVDCDDSFIAYHIFKQIRMTNGEETLITLKDESQIDIILDSIRSDYDVVVNQIEADIKELWNQGAYHRSDNKALEPFELGRFIECIFLAQKHNPNIHMTNYKAFLDGGEITDYY